MNKYKVGDFVKWKFDGTSEPWQKHGNFKVARIDEEYCLCLHLELKYGKMFRIDELVPLTHIERLLYT